MLPPPITIIPKHHTTIPRPSNTLIIHPIIHPSPTHRSSSPPKSLTPQNSFPQIPHPTLANIHQPRKHLTQSPSHGHYHLNLRFCLATVIKALSSAASARLVAFFFPVGFGGFSRRDRWGSCWGWGSHGGRGLGVLTMGLAFSRLDAGLCSDGEG